MASHKSDINVGIKFNADTQQARQQLQQLQNQLDNLMKSTANNTSQMPLNKELKEALNAAAQLKVALQAAVNVDTGNLDLSKFSAQLRQSGAQLQDYAKHFLNLGPEGEKAFMNLTKSIVTAEVPLKRSVKLFDELWTTMKNTARWELSSRVLHGFESALSNAYRYSQDLNKSLTDIRIVTGYGADRMADFAVEANKAAKALSATTDEYAKASLIYFQQGLSDQEVQKRADITVKMANVTRDSAQTVSDQMTAIWNNFADGSKTLEYYADVMTALGAETASSTAEISQGLEKFAAVASTVGLSYEYATAALATITAETRESADVVGTALKTLFARIQGLSLGETLEDGTNLTKYSEGLEKVGISIKDQNGELKDMDIILNEMAGVWENLSRDQQVALAQTVAGVRQYNQLIALMSNWDVMQSNLGIVANSSGELQKQQDIYAESWEAARDRVTAALEDIYNKLLDDKFFIGLADTFATIIDSVSNLIDTLGGLPGVLSLIGSLSTKVFSSQMATGLQTMVHNFKVFTGSAEAESNTLREDAKNAIHKYYSAGGDTSTPEEIESKVRIKEIDRSYELQQLKNISEERRAYYQTLVDLETQYGETAVAATEAVRKESEALTKLNSEARNTILDSGHRAGLTEDQIKENLEDFDDFDNYARQAAISKTNINKMKQASNIEDEKEFIKFLDQNEKILDKNSLQDLKDYHTTEDRINKNHTGNHPENQNVKYYKKLREAINQKSKSQKEEFDIEKKATEYVKKHNQETKITVEWLKDYAEQTEKSTNATENQTEALKNYDDLVKQNNGVIQEGTFSLQGWANGIVGVAGGISDVALGLSSLKGAFDILQNEDLTGWEKFTQILTSVGIAIPSLIGGFGQLTNGIKLINESGKMSAATLLATTLGLDANTAAVGANTKEQTINVIIKKTGIDVTELSANVTKKEAIENIKAAAAKSGHTVATTILAGVQAILNGQLAIGLALLAPYAAAILGVVAAVGALVIAYQQAQKNSPEGKLKALTEKAEESQKAADEAKQSYEGLKDTIEGYDRAIQKIEDLTKGTKEFKDAVEEANAKARELIETYGITSGFYIDENGIIRFEENVLGDAEQKSKDNKNNKAAADLQNDQAVREEKRIQSIDKEINNYAKAFGTSGLTVTKELNEQNASALYDFFIKNKDIKTKNENYYKELGNILGIDYDPKNNAYMSTMLEEFDALQSNDGFVALNSLVTNIGNINSDAISEMNSAAALYGTEAGYFEDTKYNNATNAYASNKDVDFTSKYDDWTTSELQAELEKMEYEYSNGKWYYQGQELTNFDRDKQVEALAGRDADADYQTRVGEFQAYSDSYKLDAKVMEAMSTGNWSNLTEDEYNLLQNPQYWNNNGNIVVGQDANGEDIVKSRYSFIEEYAKETGLTIEEFEAEINAAIKDYNDHRLEYTYAALEQEKQAYQKEAAEVKSIYDTMFEDGVEGLDEQQLAKLDELEAKYSSLAKAGERGSKQYMEALKIIQEANEAYAIGAMMDQEDNLWAQYDEEFNKTEKDAEKIQAILDQIVSTNYEIQLAINADIETDLDSIYNRIEQVSSAASKIGEGFIVSAEDIRAVAKAFPGILKNYQVLADGTIKLNEKAVKAATDAAYEEIKADKTVILEKIRNQKIEIQNRLTILRKMLEIAKKQAGGEIDLINDQKEMEAYALKYKEELANDELDVDEDLNKEKEENLDEFDAQAKESAEYTYNAFRQGAGASSQSHVDFINGAIAAMNEFVAAGNAAKALETYNDTAEHVGEAAFSWWTYNGSGSSTSGNYSGEVEGGSSKSFGDFLSDEGVDPNSYGDYVDQIQDEIGAYEDLLNEKEIQEAELLAQMNGLGSSLGGVGTGDGSGSGSQAAQAEKLDPEDEIERYHENTRQLERLTRALEKVSTAKDRAFGKERLRLIDEEITATEELVQQQRALLAETKEYLKQDFADIQQYGFTYDEYGEITNYDEVMQQQIAKYNAAVATGNQDIIDAAKEEYDEFKENMQQYEETLTAYEEAQAQLQEYINQVVDLKLEKITTEVEVKILVNDKELTRLEYLLKKIEYEGKGAADAISLMGRQFEQISEKAKPIQEAIDKIYEQARAEGRGLLEEEVKEIDSFYKDGTVTEEEKKRIQEIYEKAAAEDRMLTQDEEEQIQEYKEELLGLNEEIMDIVQTIEGKFLETLDELNGKVEESIGRFATYTGMYQTLNEVITLSGKANSKYGMDMLNALSAKTVANASQAMKANIQNYEAFGKMYLEEQANLERATQMGEERLIKYYTERLHDIEMKREASYEGMLTSWAEALQAANDLFDTQLNNMIIELKQNIGDIDKLVEIYDRATELEDLYLSGNKSIYELSKLARSVGKDIQDTSNIIAKNKLVGFLEQINKLRAEGVKLSQYDLEYWQAKYELELAEIALQEAQDAKAQVKLTRNTAGGWGYTYVADAEAVSEAQQKYEDSMYAMSEVNDEYISDYSDRLIKNRQDMTKALESVDKSRKDYIEEIMRLREYYTEIDSYLVEELQKAYDRAGVSYTDTLLGRVYGGSNLRDSQDNFINSVSETVDGLILKYQEFQGMVDNINASAGTTVEQAMGYITDASQTLESEVTDRITNLVTEVKAVSDEIWDFQETYGDAIANILATNEEYYSKTILAYQNFIDKTEAKKWLDYYEDMTPAGEVLGVAGTGTTGAMAGGGSTAVTNNSFRDMLGKAGGGGGSYSSNMSLEDITQIVNSKDRSVTGQHTSVSNRSNFSYDKISPEKQLASGTDYENFEYEVYEDSSGQGWVYVYKQWEYADGTTSGWFLEAVDPYDDFQRRSNDTYDKTKLETIGQVKRDPSVTDYDTFYDEKTGTYYGKIEKNGEWITVAAKWDSEEELKAALKEDYGLATGGYTGSWGPEGRWAMLHEKELVLNKFDTENMLDMVNTLRDIDWRAKLSELWTNIQERFITPIFGDASELLQNVQIEASFPGVSDRNEIEEAFNNLINTASQYANKKIY